MMKRSDLASLILIVAISFTLAFFLGNAIFNKPESRSTPVEVVSPIDPQMPEIDPTIFNSRAINPTEDITINPTDTDRPFDR